MQIEPKNRSNEEIFSQQLKIEKEKIICKDGFCPLQNKEENSSLIKNNVNLFDPI